MAAIALTDCKVLKKGGEVLEITIITPSTADSADTIDTSDICADGQILGLTSSWDVETGDEVTCTYATGTGVFTLDAAGGTTNHTYCIQILVRGETFTP